MYGYNNFDLSPQTSQTQRATTFGSAKAHLVWQVIASAEVSQFDDECKII